MRVLGNSLEVCGTIAIVPVGHFGQVWDNHAVMSFKFHLAHNSIMHKHELGHLYVRGQNARRTCTRGSRDLYRLTSGVCGWLGPLLRPDDTVLLEVSQLEHLSGQRHDQDGDDQVRNLEETC